MASSHGGRGDVLQCRHADDAERAETIGNGLDGRCQGAEIYLVCRLAEVIESFAFVFELELCLELVKRAHGGRDARFELFILEFHFDDAIVNTTHSEVTSFQTASAISSKTGFIAGLM